MRENQNRNYNTYAYNNFEKNPADDYQTPDWLFKYIQKKFDVKVDIAGDQYNSRIPCSPLHDSGFNALDEDWGKFSGTKFCFPPFSKPYFSQFLAKAHKEWQNGESSLIIAPIKTVSVDYFQSVRCPKIFILYPRVNFLYNGREVNAPDSICLLHYNAEIENFTVPSLEFLDVKALIPSSQRR
jgi:hypothetical protein